MNAKDVARVANMMRGEAMKVHPDMSDVVVVVRDREGNCAMASGPLKPKDAADLLVDTVMHVAGGQVQPAQLTMDRPSTLAEALQSAARGKGEPTEDDGDPADG